MKTLLSIILSSLICCLTACSQNQAQEKNKPVITEQHIGGDCENCKAIYECPVPFEQLSWIDTLPDYDEPGPKMQISGVIYQQDGKTPAKDVVLFIYHTDQQGKYSNKYNEKGWAKQQGYIRGWMKTNELGQYKFYTLLPASYPNSNVIKHIHPTIKEPGKNEYWIDSFIFEGDPYLTPEKQNEEGSHGGSGLVSLKNVNGILIGERNIYLGKNIPGYPSANANDIQSGLTIGSSCPAFDPIHLSGADKGKKACPMCKYGRGQGVMVWFNHNNPDQLKTFVQLLEQAMVERGESRLRVFLVYMNPSYKENDYKGLEILRGKLAKWASEQQLNKVALTWVPSPIDEETCGKYLINQDVKNTVFIYKKRKVVAKWINMEYSVESVKAILEKIDNENI